MSENQRVQMSKPNGKDAIAKANVLPENVKAWEKQGWKQIKPTKKEGGK